MTLEEVIALIKSLTTSDFYGSIEIKMERGRILFCRKVETIKSQGLVQVSEQPGRDD